MKILIAAVCLSGFTTLCVPGAFAQSAGIFTPGPQMNDPRASHTAVMLNDGKVLITGGSGPLAYGAPLNTAEIYNPKTGKFARTGNMYQARVGHAATLLPDGTVLISGGYGASTLELYRPSLGYFEIYATIPDAPAQGTASYGALLLPYGQVLLATVPAAQVFDPQSKDIFGRSI
jgi:hypothetical protein